MEKGLGEMTVSTEQGEPPDEILSKEEIEILRLVALGLSNHEIAQRLSREPNTVRAYLYTIYSKINVSSRTAAAHYAAKHGLL